MNSDSQIVAALDVGGRRIGVALGRRDTRLASPLTTLINDDQIWEKLQRIIAQENVGTLVVGLPRGLDGQETGQTQTVRDFVTELQAHFELPVVWQDEAGTSVEAEAQLCATRKRYNKHEIDAQAAAIILQDYLNNQEAS